MMNLVLKMAKPAFKMSNLCIAKQDSSHAVISFSHFLPRLDLLPAKVCKIQNPKSKIQKSDGFCIENDEFCIQNDGLRIENEVCFFVFCEGTTALQGARARVVLRWAGAPAAAARVRRARVRPHAYQPRQDAKRGAVCSAPVKVSGREAAL